MSDTFYPPRQDIPKASAADIFYTQQLVLQVNAMNTIDSELVQNIQQFSSMPLDEFVRQKNLVIPNDVAKEIARVQHAEEVSNSMEEQQESESMELNGQKGSDDESTDNNSEPDEI